MAHSYSMPGSRLCFSVFAFLLVTAGHALAIYSLAMGSEKPAPASAPVIQGVLVSAPVPVTPAIEKALPQKAAKTPVRKMPTTSPVEAKPMPDTVNEQAINLAPAEELVADTPTATPAENLNAEPVVIPPRVDARNLDNPVPAYPRLSRRLNETGTVMLEILIMPDGSVAEMRLHTSSGYKRLDNAALHAVKQWRYLPAKRGDEAISYWYMQPVTFALH